jgi:aminoglycoside phosphotransferase family enzyme
MNKTTRRAKKKKKKSVLFDFIDFCLEKRKFKTDFYFRLNSLRMMCVNKINEQDGK